MDIQETFLNLGEDTPLRAQIAYEILSKGFNRAKLVRVERMVTRRGKTFLTHLWIKPSRVRKTDVVTHNRHLLPRNHPALRNKPRSHGNAKKARGKKAETRIRLAGKQDASKNDAAKRKEKTAPTDRRTARIEAANPGRKSKRVEYKINCQRSCIAYELLCRGIKATALPGAKSAEDDDELAYVEAVLNAFHGAREVDCGARTGRESGTKVREWMHRFGNGARALVGITPKGQKHSHLFFCENVNGKICFCDPQRGMDNVDWYFNRAVGPETFLIRVDNLELTTFAEKFVRIGKE